MPSTPPLRIPALDLPPVTVPEATTYWPGVGAMFTTGTESVAQIVSQFRALPPQDVALDIETRGVALGRWQITCVTAAFRLGDGTVHSVLFNPLRADRDREGLRTVIEHATRLVFHNSVFDIPPMYCHKLIGHDEIRKVGDTILLARMLHTNTTGGRTLEALAQKYGIAADSSVKIVDAFTAGGFSTHTGGYENSDLDRPFYRYGAMSDTAVTLRLWEDMYPLVVDVHTRGGPNSLPISMLSREAAVELVEKVQRVNQITLQASARGMNWDRDYMDQWFRDQEQSLDEANSTLTTAGLTPGNGAQLVKLLNERGELPKGWPTTEKGALKSDKDTMNRLSSMGHPLSSAHTVVAEYAKNSNYLHKIAESASSTGRVHPSTGILGAQATGRMSVQDPPLQQFSESARPVICSDGEDWWSVDWSSIEPVILANAAGDRDFITPFNEGGDLYIPLARRAGLIPSDVPDADAKGHPGRKKAKDVLLAAMYGQGLPSLSEKLGITYEEARRIQQGIRRSMATTFEFMDTVQNGCKWSGASWTIMGRMLDERLPNGDIVDRKAVNHFCQGSAGDVLMNAVLELDKAGMADEIRMLIHDEIVITERGLEACKEVMTTPPQELTDLSGQRGLSPLLRIDAQNMGKHWQKV